MELMAFCSDSDISFISISKKDTGKSIAIKPDAS
jgi:hypothetical protein